MHFWSSSLAVRWFISYSFTCLFSAHQDSQLVEKTDTVWPDYLSAGSNSVMHWSFGEKIMSNSCKVTVTLLSWNEKIKEQDKIKNCLQIKHRHDLMLNFAARLSQLYNFFCNRAESFTSSIIPQLFDKVLVCKEQRHFVAEFVQKTSCIMEKVSKFVFILLRDRLNLATSFYGIVALPTCFFWMTYV